MSNYISADAKAEPWTWLHKKVFSQSEQELHKQLGTAACAKIDLPLFTQLVFSWNAFRPKKGYFTFYAQVRDAQTKQWSKWHRMSSWGADIQKSFKTEADHLSSFHHVRLEASKPKNADAFAIKVEAHEGADLSLLKSFAVNLSNFDRFIPESEKNLKRLKSTLVTGVPCFSQLELNHPRNDGLCSPTSCAMLTSYLTDTHIDPIDFAEKSHDSGLDKYGSWPFNMAHAFERSDGKISFAVTRFHSFKNLCDHLAKGIPVVVSVRGFLEGAPKVYSNGHLLVVVGYDHKSKEVICNDPAVSDSKFVQKRYRLKNFLHAWERSHRLAYLADPIQKENT